MHIFRGLQDLTHVPRDPTLILGSFDGVHCGHAALVDAARVRQNPVGIVTFSPHPRLLTQKKQEPFLLTSDQQKYAALRALGADFCVELQFTREFASISAEDFVSEILVRRLGVGHIICGYNYRFGAGRAGDVPLIARLGAQLGFSIESLGPVLDHAGEPYSSTRIRNYLRSGDIEGATALLGRTWSIEAAMQREPDAREARGHFHFGNYLKPLPAHYDVCARLEDGTRVDGRLVVSQQTHTGWLEFPGRVSLPPIADIELEFLGLARSTVMQNRRDVVDVERACYI
jgi:riboflavin kinase / FMN adenylyltransferase